MSTDQIFETPRPSLQCLPKTPQAPSRNTARHEHSPFALPVPDFSHTQSTPLLDIHLPDLRYLETPVNVYAHSPFPVLPPMEHLMDETMSKISGNLFPWDERSTIRQEGGVQPAETIGLSSTQSASSTSLGTATEVIISSIAARVQRIRRELRDVDDELEAIMVQLNGLTVQPQMNVV
ncbi:hypothetical protein NM688_g9034 [Phlebia brevispora]|uniref:Uncharacterized protein n=1 Tax=Phlebia brevispora TaxID=194682 RepID=A0ACC1RLH9_9APHY|nr:hypothetical protein NM688_g9034 [Phlebia brevispora]